MTPRAIFLAVDPGLMATGWALFYEPPGLLPLDRLPEFLVATGSATSSPTDDDDARHRILAFKVMAGVDALGLWGVTVGAVIEKPAIAGQYGRASGVSKMTNAKDVERNVRVGGFLAGVIHGRNVATQFLAADKTAKRARRQRILMMGVTVKNDHEADAVWLGIRALTDPRRLLNRKATA